MFGGSVMSSGNLQGEDRALLIATLGAFSTAVTDACRAQNLALGQVPFFRPSNFLAVLNPDAIHLVVDDVPVGAMPVHTCMDRRQEASALPLDAVLGASFRELGFRKPVGVTIPLSAYTDDETRRRDVLNQLAKNISQKLAERAMIQRLQLPTGFEHYARFMPAFLRDHPTVDNNVFLMMRFRGGEQYDEIHKAICDGMAKYGLTVLRADDKDYTGDLWENVCLYMLGCRYGVAVFEEIDVREFNPNVALELGFMIAHNKRCLLIKDQRMPRMPTDIVGKLYKEFDTYAITSSMSQAIDRWAGDVDLEPSAV